MRPNRQRDPSVDYANPASVRALNQALLREAYGLSAWDIPPGYLCPPVPGRSDYIHHLADVLARGLTAIPRGATVRVLDIGVGANCIYPLIGAREYGWSFVGSEVDPVALRWARHLASSNPAVRELIECREQTNRLHCLQGVVRPGEFFDATLCNPPFHASAKDAREGQDRKVRNLRAAGSRSPSRQRNFGGQAVELWCPGGELAFVRRLIAESSAFRDQCRWFTVLVSKSENLAPLRKALIEVEVTETKVIDMAQGQKKSRILAWTFAPPLRVSGKRER